MEKENLIASPVKVIPEMAFKETDCPIPTPDATNTMKFTSNHQSKNEVLFLGAKQIQVSNYENCASEVPKAVNLQSFAEMICFNEIKYEILEDYIIKQESDYTGSVEASEDRDIKTEMLSDETNSGDIDEQTIKAEELIIKDKGDVDAIDINVHKSQAEIFENNEKSSTKPSSQSTKTIYQYSKCSYQSVRATELQRRTIKHNELTTGLTKFYCKHCVYNCYKKLTFYEHLRIHNNNNPHVFKKKQINFQILSEHSYSKQLMMTITNKVHKCQKCSYKSAFELNLKRHLLKHKEIDSKNHFHIEHLMDTITRKIHKCQQCPYTTFYRTTMKRHLLKHNATNTDLQKFYCEYCVFSTYHKSSLNTHLRIHGNSHRHVSTICSKSFIEKTQIDFHILREHSDNEQLMATITKKIHKCQLCSYKCLASSHMKVHLLKHKEMSTDFRKFNCEYCVYSTYHKSSINRHVLIHSNSHRHVCTLCGKGFIQKFEIDTHILRKHSDNEQLMATITRKIHKCQQCSYKCLGRSIMKVHLLKHKEMPTDFRKLNCQYCVYSSYYKSSLKRHVLIHSNRHPQVCTICGKRFIRKYQIDDHILREHSDNEQLMATITRKIHTCQQCSYKCLASSMMKRHSLKHKELPTDLKKFQF